MVKEGVHAKPYNTPQTNQMEKVHAIAQEGVPRGPEEALNFHNQGGGRPRPTLRHSVYKLLFTSSKISTKVITGQWSALVPNSFACDFQLWLSQYKHFSKFKIYVLHFLSNHPETFRICSRHDSKDIKISKYEILIRFLNQNYNYEF